MTHTVLVALTVSTVLIHSMDSAIYMALRGWGKLYSLTVKNLVILSLQQAGSKQEERFLLIFELGKLTLVIGLHHTGGQRNDGD